MRLRRPSARELDALFASDAPHSYLEVGRSAELSDPGVRHALASAGYAVDVRPFPLGRGRDLFERARTALSRWRQFEIPWLELLHAGPVAKGQVVATLANMLNPELIVLSGSIAQSNDILLAAAREAIYGASHPLVSRDLQIIRSQMGSSSGLVGAAIVAAEGMFSPAVLRDWIMAGRPQAHPQFLALKGRIEAQAVATVAVTRPPKA